MNELHRLFHFCSIDDVKSLKKNINLISDINQPDKEKGWTLLSVSCYHHSRKCVEYLLSNEANINIVSNKGTTVLMYAKTKVIQNNDFSFLDFLIGKGANVYAKDVNGKNIMDYCLSLNAKKLVSYFKPYFT